MSRVAEVRLSLALFATALVAGLCVCYRAGRVPADTAVLLSVSAVGGVVAVRTLTGEPRR